MFIIVGCLLQESRQVRCRHFHRVQNPVDPVRCRQSQVSGIILHVLQENPSRVEIIVAEDEAKDQSDSRHDEQYQFKSYSAFFHSMKTLF